MKQDKERFEAHYTNKCNESVRSKLNNHGKIEFLTTKKYMNKVIPQNSKILDACAGCGYYSFFLAEQGHTVTSGDYVQHNVNEIRKQQDQNPILHDIYTGSVIDLSQFCDDKFDVVLNMGAYYHITDKDERLKSISECLRVLKHGGLFFMTYINVFHGIISMLLDWKEDFSLIEKKLEQGYYVDDSLYYSSTPEEVEDVMQSFNLHILHNIATDGLNTPIAKTLNSMSDEVFERYMNFHYKTCEIKSILGYSSHALIICRK